MSVAFISEKTLMSLLGVSRTTIRRWSANDIGPKRVKIGPRRVGYVLDDVQEFVGKKSKSFDATQRQLSAAASAQESFALKKSGVETVAATAEILRLQARLSAQSESQPSRAGLSALTSRLLAALDRVRSRDIDEWNDALGVDCTETWYLAPDVHRVITAVLAEASRNLPDSPKAALRAKDS